MEAQWGWAVCPKKHRLQEVVTGFQVQDRAASLLSLPSLLTITSPKASVWGLAFLVLSVLPLLRADRFPRLPVAPPRPTWRRHGGRRSWSRCSQPRSPVASAGAPGRCWLWCWGSLLLRSTACPHTGCSRLRCWHLVPEGQKWWGSCDYYFGLWHHSYIQSSSLFKSANSGIEGKEGKQDLKKWIEV